MAFVYRFKNSQEEVIYVGYTGQTLERRMQQHWEKGHLPKECYNQVSKIEYMKYKTKADAMIMETYFINKYKPIYNKQNKQMDNITIQLNVDEKWKLYRVLKPRNKIHPIENLIMNLLETGCIALIILLIAKFLNLF